MGNAVRSVKKEEAYPPVFKVLSDRELEITELMAKHMSNKEIAQSLFLSEGTVKQYINQIYSKLQIPGDVRVKRKYLLELMEGKSLSLVLTPQNAAALPQDARIQVGDQTYSCNGKNEIIIPIGTIAAGSKTLTLTSKICLLYTSPSPRD